MTRFRIRYRDPESEEDEWRTRHCDFDDWTGRATLDGREVGPVMTITAREWAEDLAYSLADKGPYEIEELASVS
jgi:hypothetical protein